MFNHSILCYGPGFEPTADSRAFDKAKLLAEPGRIVHTGSYMVVLAARVLVKRGVIAGLKIRLFNESGSILYDVDRNGEVRSIDGPDDLGQNLIDMLLELT